MIISMNHGAEDDWENRRVFATALEVHYPTNLCDAIASAFAAAFRRKGLQPHFGVNSNLAARAFADNQPPSNKVATFLPDFKAKFIRILHDNVQIWPISALDISSAKLLHTAKLGGDDMQQLTLALQRQCIQWQFDVAFSNFDCLIFPCFVELQLFGLLWSEEEFVRKALEAKHPLSVEDAVPKPLVDAIHANLNYSDHEIALKRTKFLSKWTARAKQLVSAETALKNSMDPVVAKAVAAKRILLFEEMLVETKFPDLSVVDELKNGADLVGEVASTGMLPGKLVPALSTVDELSCSSRRIRSKVENDRQGSGDKDVDNQVWEKTMEEVAKGWLIGPLTSEEVPDWQPISRRFGLLQKKGKIEVN